MIPKCKADVLAYVMLQGNRNVELDPSFAKYLLNHVGFKAKAKRIAGCSAYASFFRLHGRGDLTSDDNEAKPAGDLGRSSERNKSNSTSAGDSQGHGDKRKESPREGGESAKDSEAPGSKRKQTTQQAGGGPGGPQGGGPPEDRGDMDSYIVTLSKTLAAATFPVFGTECKRPKVLLFCAQNERNYCRRKVEEVGMCAALAAQKGGVSAFCEEDKGVIPDREICHEYFDSAVPESICSPSCAQRTGVSRSSFSWNTSDASECGDQNDACDLGKAVFCNRKEPVMNESKCVQGDCKDEYCLEYELGMGATPQSSSYRGPNFN